MAINLDDDGGITLQELVRQAVAHLKSEGAMKSTVQVKSIEATKRGRYVKITVTLTEGHPLIIEADIPADKFN